VNSWKIEEYYTAIKHNPFFESVKEVLDASTLETTPNELIVSKYHFAGGSARYMFDFKTNEVVDKLDQSVRSVQDVLPYIQGTIGDQSNFVVNRLFNIFVENSKWKQSIVSEYAANQLAMKVGPILVANLVKALKKSSNPAMDGWFLEMWVFASLCEEGVKLYDENRNEESWPQADQL
jgi:hypothetical protein